MRYGKAYPHQWNNELDEPMRIGIPKNIRRPCCRYCGKQIRPKARILTCLDPRAHEPGRTDDQGRKVQAWTRWPQWSCIRAPGSDKGGCWVVSYWIGEWGFNGNGNFCCGLCAAWWADKYPFDGFYYHHKVSSAAT